MRSPARAQGGTRRARAERARFFTYNRTMMPQRYGQVWLYHGGTPLRELLQPHGYREHVAPLENPEHDEVNRAEPEDAPEGDEIQL